MKKSTKKTISYLIIAMIIIGSLAVFTNRGNNGTFLETNGEYSNIAKEQILGYVKDYSNLDLSETWEESEVYEISLEGNKITSNANLEIKGSVIYIKDGGDYLISGTLNDGQIIVYSEDKQSVRLILNGVDISSSSEAPITILNAEQTIITLVEGTTNYLTGTGEYTNSTGNTDSTTATIYSKDDLYINGQGSIIINSENKNGIQSKDQLVILNGNFEINAAKEAIKAKDYIVIEDGSFNLVAGEDGIRTTEEDDPERGFILIEDGIFNIQSARDGIQAESYLIIEKGDIDIITVPIDKSRSAKGLKAGDYLEINNGKINIESSDDGIHSDGIIVINEGGIIILSGDDGIHADESVTINNGEIEIQQSVEGIEGKNIYVNGGEISVVSSDDGINVADSSGETMRAISDAGLYISGGDLYVNANGDGLDSNGDLYIYGGEIIVDGPIRNDNGGFDCNGEFTVNGGYFIVVGSAGMAESPGKNSEQNSVSIVFSETLEAGTTISINSGSGEEIFFHTSAKVFQSFVASSEELETGESYKIYKNGELYEEFTISNGVTQIGNSIGQGMGGGGMRGFR